MGAALFSGVTSCSSVNHNYRGMRADGKSMVINVSIGKQLLKEAVLKSGSKSPSRFD